MEYTLETSGDMHVLTLNGELTIEHAGELKKVMIDALKNADHVAVTVGDVKEIDLSCFQLLCSAHRTALKSNKQLTLSSRDSKIFQRMVKDSGYARHDSCALNPSQTCLWCGG
jgi:anti-anti-sigma factor